ncbi:MAG: hypothetical protein ACJ8AK_02995 [Gemmatimonadaceae bacterium]
MPLPKGSAEEVQRAAQNLGADEAIPAEKDGGSARQLFPTTKHVRVETGDVVTAATEAHHRVFHLPDHGMHVVVAIEEKVLDADHYAVLHADCWEVDETGAPTGLRAATGTHSIPHHTLVGPEAIDVADVIDLMTAIMAERIANRKQALSVFDSFPVKRAAREELLRTPKFPRGIADPHSV